ncbi:IS1380 family transposase, partial [Candidatus Auribacterota bacterium]
MQSVLPFKIDITREKLTAHSGLALFSEYNHGIGLHHLVDNYLPKPGSGKGYDPSIFVNSIVLMLQGGGRYLEDLRELKQEQELMKLLKKPIIPDPDTVGDWCRRMGMTGSSGLSGLDKVRSIINHRVMRKELIIEYTLDADATEVIAEKRDAKMTYKGNKGYFPMLGFLSENSLCIYDEFREGNDVPQNRQKEFYLSCCDRMPKGKRIGFYRADSASYQGAL